MKGLTVSIPLTLTQCLTQTIHNHHLCGITPTEIVANAALAYSIYGNDRITNDNGITTEKAFVNLATTTAIGIFALDTYTLPLGILVPFLVYDYSKLKRNFSNIKPFFVSFFWTICTYLQPLLFRHDLNLIEDAPFVISLFLLFSSFSHISDIKDINEDLENDIYTPAVILGEHDSKKLAYALTATGLLAHSFSDYSFIDFGYDFFMFGMIISYLESIQTTLLTMLGIIFYYSNKHDIFVYDFMTELIKSSDTFHTIGTNSLPWLIEHTSEFPTEIRKKIILTWMDVLNDSDAFGSFMMKKYMEVIKNTHDFLN